MTNPRTKARIEARIKERVAHCVEFELSDPRSAFVTITGVEVSSDLSVAKVLYSVYGTEGEKSRVAHMLKDATGFVRGKVARVLRTRRVPRLVWIYDESIEIQDRMARVIQDALKHDRDVNPAAHQDLAPAEEEEDEEEVLEQEYLDFLSAQEEGEEAKEAEPEEREEEPRGRSS